MHSAFTTAYSGLPSNISIQMRRASAASTIQLAGFPDIYSNHLIHVFDKYSSANILRQQIYKKSRLLNILYFIGTCRFNKGRSASCRLHSLPNPAKTYYSYLRHVDSASATSTIHLS